MDKPRHKEAIESDVHFRRGHAVLVDPPTRLVTKRKAIVAGADKQEELDTIQPAGEDIEPS